MNAQNGMILSILCMMLVASCKEQDGGHTMNNLEMNQEEVAAQSMPFEWTPYVVGQEKLASDCGSFDSLVTYTMGKNPPEVLRDHKCILWKKAKPFLMFDFNQVSFPKDSVIDFYCMRKRSLLRHRILLSGQHSGTSCIEKKTFVLSGQALQGYELSDFILQPKMSAVKVQMYSANMNAYLDTLVNFDRLLKQ
jgi:hypothetical protein